MTLGVKVRTFSGYSSEPTDVFQRLVDSWYNGDTVWAEVTTGARKGSIGKLVPQGVLPGTTLGLPTKPKPKDYYDRSTWYSLSRAELIFGNDRANLTMYGFDDVVWLPDYTGDVVWKFTRGPGKPQVTPLDQMGIEVEVGDLVMFGYKVYNTKGITQLLGRVTAISKAGVLTVKRTKLKEEDYESEYRVPTPHGVIKLHDDIFKELMIRKLSFS